MAVLWLAVPTTSAACGAIRIVPNVNGPQVESGTLLQEAEGPDEAAAGAEEEGEPAADESATEESSNEESSAEESSEVSDAAGDTEE
jgi:hypothetical protein